MPKKLSGREYQQLQKALLSAFPKRTDLAQMLLFQLGESLDAIVANGNLSETMFSLIQWVIAQGRLGELIEGAHTFNPGSVELRDFFEQVWQAKVAEPAPPNDQTVAPANQPTTSPLDPDERAHLIDLLAIQQNNLHKLERQAALYGALEVPLSLQNQLDLVRGEITKLETRLGMPHTQVQSEEPRVAAAAAAPLPASPPQPRARQQDTYSSYEAALEQLLRRLGSGHARYSEALTYQQRLIENVDTSRRYGDTETTRAGRAQIVGQLNSLALDELGIAFNDLK